MALEIGLLRIPKLFLKHMGVTIMVGVVEKGDFFFFEQFYLPLELGHFHGTNINVMICLPYKSHNVPLPQKLLIFIFIFFNFFFLREYTPLVTYFIYLINQFFWSWEYNDDHNLQLRSKNFKPKKERKK